MTTTSRIPVHHSFHLDPEYPTPAIFVLPGHITLREGDLAMMMRDEILKVVWDRFGEALALDAGFVLKENRAGFYGAAVVQELKVRAKYPGIVMWQSRYYDEDPDSLDILREGFPVLEKVLKGIPHAEEILVFRPPNVSLPALARLLDTLPSGLRAKTSIVRALC